MTMTGTFPPSSPAMMPLPPLPSIGSFGSPSRPVQAQPSIYTANGNLSMVGGASPMGSPMSSMTPVGLKSQPLNGFSPLPLPFQPGPLGTLGVDTFSPVLSDTSGISASPATSIPAYPGAIGPAASLTAENQPLNAQQMGQKVGTVVSNFMQENPALLHKLNQVDMDDLADDIGPKVEKARIQVQQALKKLPQGIDKRLIRMLDPGTAKLATEFDQWLRKEPDPVLLAEILKNKRLKDREEALDGKAGKAKADLYADDSFADSLPTSQPSLKDKLMNAKDKLMEKAQSIWPFKNRNKKSDDLAELLGRHRPAGGDALTEADLDALLNGGLFFKANAPQDKK